MEGNIMRLATGTSLFAWAALLGLAGASAAVAAPTDDDVKKAEKAVKEHLDTLKGSAAKVEYVKDEAVQRVLPKALVFAVRFPQYPVGRIPPKGLKAANVFTVDGDGKVKVITDRKELLELFSALDAVKTDDAAKDAARAYVRLTQELHQDGYYQFALMDDSTKVTTDKGARKASAKVVVMKGGNGEINATLAFDDKGKLSKID